MKRIRDSELDYRGRDGLYCHEGRPFTGIAYTDYPTGELKCEVEFRDGVPWGIQRKYFPSGTIAEEGHSHADFDEGLWRTWHGNGQLAAEENREFGCTLSRARWDVDGRQIEEYQLKETDPQFAILRMYRELYGKSGYLPHTPAQ